MTAARPRALSLLNTMQVLTQRVEKADTKHGIAANGYIRESSKDLEENEGAKGLILSSGLKNSSDVNDIHQDGVGKKSAEYMNHLDGLRMVALFGVLLFHFKLFGAEGGFLGVDVFFVLSGFLVTGIIMRELGAAGEYDGLSKFSLASFYTKRFWRLYPSSLATSIWTLFGAWIMFPPELTAKVAKSVLASMVSISNMLFFTESGYWDADSATKPLLHTWSLSVEEQFYFFWPYMLILLSKALHKIPTISAKRIFVVGFFAMLTMISFVGAWRMYGKDPSMAFFLLPARVYEFSLGAMCSPLYRYTSLWKGPVWEVVTLTAMMIIFGSFFVLTEATGELFFGFYSFPVLLSTIVVMMLPNAFINSKILSHRFSQYIGKVSYSLYLVHWPLWVFQVFQRDIMVRIQLPEFWFGLLAFAVTAVFGQGQFALVEEKLRFRGAIPKIAKLIMIGCVAGVALVSLSLVYLSSDSEAGVVELAAEPAIAQVDMGSDVQPTCQQQGLDAIQESVATMRHVYQMCQHNAARTNSSVDAGCLLGDPSKKPSAILIGDVAMWSLAQGFNYAAGKLGVSLQLFAQPGCKTTAEWYLKSESAPNTECGWVHSKARKALEALPAETTVFFADVCYDWCTMRTAGQVDCKEYGKKEIEYFKSMRLNVVFVGMPPLPPFNPWACPVPNRESGCVAVGPVSKYFEQDGWMRNYVELELGIKYFDLYSWFRASDVENSFTFYAENYALFEGEGCLSELGSIYTGPKIAELLRTYLNLRENKSNANTETSAARVPAVSASKPPSSGQQHMEVTIDKLLGMKDTPYKREGLLALKESFPIRPHFKVCDFAKDDVNLGGSRRIACILGDHTKHPSAILMGDSMMYTMVQAFNYAANKLGMSVLNFAIAGCRPTVKWYQQLEPVPDTACGLRHLETAKALPAIPRGTTLFFSTYSFNVCAIKHGKLVCYDYMKREMEYFRSLGFDNIVFLGMPPYTPFNPVFCPKPSSGPACKQFAPSDKFYGHEEIVRKHWEESLNVTYFPISQWLQPEEGVNNYTYFIEDIYLYKGRDDHHMGDFGGVYMGPLIVELFKKHLKPTKKPWVGSSVANLLLDEPLLR